MDTAWIQVFVLTIAECVAPAGKTVCQEQQFELAFLSRADCEVALEQFVSLKEASATVIVDRNRSRCSVSASEHPIFADLDDVRDASQGIDGWQPPSAASEQSSASQVSHQERLEQLPSCDEASGRAPCKMGGIIVEGAVQGETVEVWRRQQ